MHVWRSFEASSNADCSQSSYLLRSMMDSREHTSRMCKIGKVFGFAIAPARRVEFSYHPLVFSNLIVDHLQPNIYDLIRNQRASFSRSFPIARQQNTLCYPAVDLLTVPRTEVPNESLFPTQLSKLKSHTTLTLHAAGMV